MSLKDSHEKVKNYVLSYFSLYDIEFIPSTNCSVIDKGKILIFPVVLGVLTSFTGWHLMFQMTSMENLMDFTFNFNVTVAGVQTIITFICVNLIYKDDFFTVLKYFDDITTSEVEFLTKTRMDHLQSSISIAWKLIRVYFIGASILCLPLSFVGLIQLKLDAPLIYTIPGLPADTVFYYPVNIIVQPIHFYFIMESIVSMDCLFIVYLFYIRGELYAINSVAEQLINKEILESDCYKILLLVHRAHRKVMNKFSIISNVMWHFYWQKFFGVSLYMCGSFFVSKNDLFGVIPVTFTIFQLLLLSGPGQLISDCSEMLNNTFYMILWYEMKLKDQKNLLIMMIGAQKSIQPETLGIGQISIYTFVQVAKTAFSYAMFAYAVLL
uniref:Odorant receptor n=1 Tax=Phlebotomus papatasi TaxID=29031 RepID=A0A3F2ZEB5_PHLPP